MNELEMMKRCFVACVMTVIGASPLMAADLPLRDHAVVRHRRAEVIIHQARIVSECENGDDALVLRCGRSIALPADAAYDPLDKRYIELSIARRHRPYEQLFSWGRYF